MRNADELIPEAKVRERYGVSAMTLWRWDRTPNLGFPPAIVIRRRKYRRASELERWEQKLPRKEAA
jgi:hypothetical protein